MKEQQSTEMCSKDKNSSSAAQKTYSLKDHNTADKTLSCDGTTHELQEFKGTQNQQ